MQQQLIIGAGCRYEAVENLVVVYDGDGRCIGSLVFASAEAVANMIGGLTACEFFTRDAEVPSFDHALEAHEVMNEKALALVPAVPATRLNPDDAADYEYRRQRDETCRFDTDTFGPEGGW